MPHQITAMAVDSSGANESSTIEVTIVTSDLPDLSVIAAVADVFENGPATAPPAATGWLPWAGAGGAALLLAMVVGMFVRERTPVVEPV